MKTIYQNHFKSNLITTALIFTLLAGFSTASAMQEHSDLLVGKIQGYSFVDGSRFHPVDSRDPLVAAERMFVFVNGSGKSDFYIVNNMDRSTLTSYIGKEVRLRGVVQKINNRKTIEVDRLESRQGDQWRTKWSEMDRMIKYPDH